MKFRKYGYLVRILAEPQYMLSKQFLLLQHRKLLLQCWVVHVIPLLLTSLTFVLHHMENEPEHELERLVSKDGDDATLAFDNAGPSTHRRLVVIFELVYLNPRKTDKFSTLYVLPKDISVATAVEHVTTHFPEDRLQPDFSNVRVYFKGNLDESFSQITDLSPDWLTVFGDDDKMVIRNDLDYTSVVNAIACQESCIGIPIFITIFTLLGWGFVTFLVWLRG